MPPDTATAWRCSVCGYIHRGAAPPDMCPLCGAPKDAFEPFSDALAPETSAAKTWRCLICHYTHDGSTPPDACPLCGALPEQFERFAPPDAETRPAEKPVKALIIGAGIAGVAAAESLRAACQNAEITLLSKEPDLPYYRLNLTRYLAGEVSADQLPIHPENWYQENNIELLRGEEAAHLSLRENTVETASGRRLSYERLLIAAGAHPFLPPFPGASKKGVTCLRTRRDAEHILESDLRNARCVCIGGGILGLETAGALRRRGAEVTLLEGHGWLLPRQLNRRAGEILADHTASTGIRILPQARTQAIEGDDRVRAVLLEDGAKLPADLVVIAAGIRSNTHLARRAGLEVHHGIVVDNRLAASCPQVFAAGDAAEHLGTVYGIWGPSQYQGGIAGINMAGGNAEFGGVPRANTLKVLGIHLFSIGCILPEDASYLAVEGEHDGDYCRFLFRDNRLAGAILLGDTSASAAISRAIETGADLSALLSKHPDSREVLHHFSA